MASILCDLGVAARAIQDDKILLVKESARPLPKQMGTSKKGSVDEGETPENAVIRELLKRQESMGQ